MFGLSHSQITGAIERLLYIFVPMLTAHGITTRDDEQLIVTAVLAIVGAGIGIWNNRAKRLADRAAKANPDTITVASPELAAGTKASNIVSARDFTVTPK